MNLGLHGEVAVRVLGCEQQTPPLIIFSKSKFIGRIWMEFKELMTSWRSKFGDRQEPRRDGGPRIRLQAHFLLVFYHCQYDE